MSQIKKLSIELSDGPEIPPRVYVKQKLKHVHEKTCTLMFTAALLVVFKKYKQAGHGDSHLLIPALWEAEAGGSTEVRSSRLAWPTW